MKSSEWDMFLYPNIEGIYMQIWSLMHHSIKVYGVIEKMRYNYKLIINLMTNITCNIAIKCKLIHVLD